MIIAAYRYTFLRFIRGHAERAARGLAVPYGIWYEHRTRASARDRGPVAQPDRAAVS
jgi:hypothetical protein